MMQQNTKPSLLFPHNLGRLSLQPLTHPKLVVLNVDKFESGAPSKVYTMDADTKLR